MSMVDDERKRPTYECNNDECDDCPSWEVCGWKHGHAKEILALKIAELEKKVQDRNTRAANQLDRINRSRFANPTLFKQLSSQAGYTQTNYTHITHTHTPHSSPPPE